MTDGIKVLEIGPDTFPSTYRSLADEVSVSSWDTLDVCENASLTYQKSPEYQFPIPSESYDVVLSGQVIEHVRKPWTWVRELARITRPGGLVITIGPVSWPYHEVPVDCWRIYPEGMRALYEDANLLILHSSWGSFEAPGYRRYIPGKSRESQPRRTQIIYAILGMFGFPVERSYDTVTIGTKCKMPIVNLRL